MKKKNHCDQENKAVEKLKFSRIMIKKVSLYQPGARFSKVSQLFGRISGGIIHFVSSTRRRLEAGNFAVISIFISFRTYEKNSFTE